MAVDPKSYTNVEVDVQAEAAKLGAQHDVPVADFGKPCQTSYGEFFKGQVRQYYAGRDHGYREGFVAGTRVRWPGWVNFAIGAVSALAVVLAIKIAVKFAAVVAAVAQALSS